MANVTDSMLSRVPAFRQLRAAHYAEYFADFCHAAWSVVFPADKLCWSPALDYLCEVLAAVRNRDPHYRRMLWNQPVRTGKSFIASIAYPCWVLLTDPAHQFVCASYSMDLGVLHNLARRNLILSPWYQKLFGERFQLSGDRNTTTHFTTEQGGGCFVASVGSRLLGFGFHTAICDDIMDAEIALSDAARASAHSWFDSTLRTRANDPATAAIFSVSQRLHEDDTTGHLLASESGVWTHVAIPLVAEEAIEYTFPGGHVWRRPAGDVLQPKRFPPKVLEELQAKRLRWASMYQQSPLCLSGNMVRDADLRYYGGVDPHTGITDEQLPGKFDFVAIGVDCAFKNYSDSDFTAIVSVGVLGVKRFILEVINRHFDVAQMEQAICAQREKWGATAIIIEAAASGIAVAQRLKVNVGGVIEVTPSGGKVARFAAVCPEFQAGQWLLDRNAAWCEPTRLQLLTFPKSKNDDIVDAIAHGGIWLQQHQFSGAQVPFQVVPRSGPAEYLRNLLRDRPPSTPTDPRGFPPSPQVLPGPAAEFPPDVAKKIIDGIPLTSRDEDKILFGQWEDDE